MKVLLRRNVKKLGQIGEVVEVKIGYARNYLLPYGMAVAPSEANLKQVEGEKQAYLEQLAREKAQLQARAKVLDGREYTLSARANEEGHLYGSIGPAQLAAAIGKDGLEVVSEHIVLEEPIRRLGRYEITIEFTEGVTAKVNVMVVGPSGELPPEPKPEAEQPAAAEEAAPAPEAPAEQAPTEEAPK